MFIVFEGPDGSGKSTQAAMLYQRLLQAGVPALLTREPGGTPLGLEIRHILHDRHDMAISPQAELLLFCADRAQHVQDVIMPGLQAGQVVVCDRYADSSIAYQGYGHGLNLAMVEEVSRWSAKGVEPTLRVYLDLTVEEGLRRKQAALAGDGNTDRATAEWTRIDAQALEFHQRVREGYLKLVATGGNWVRFDAAAAPERIHAAIWQLVAARLGAGPAGRPAAPGGPPSGEAMEQRRRS